MNKRKVAGFLIFVFSFLPLSYAAPLLDSNVDAALNSAETLFRMMKGRNYGRIWPSLTEKSKNVIVNDVYKAERSRAGADLTKENIAGDFNSGGPLSRSYWNGFLNNFDPDTVLTQSKWEIARFEKNRGEIVIKYRKSEEPAILQMYKEQGSWKVGLVETFWTRKPAS